MLCLYVSKRYLPSYELNRSLQRMSDAELYWIVKHGIKMTGMPVFGPTHEEAKLWSVVAFLRQLPELQPEAYSARVQSTQAKQEKGSGEEGHQHH